MLIDKTTGRVVEEDAKARKLYRARQKRWLLIAILFTAVFSFMPDIEVEKYLDLEKSGWFDMLQQALYYFILTLFLLNLLPEEKRSVSFLLSIFSISFFFELAQLIIPGRNFSIADLGSNLLGIATASLIMYFYDSIKPDPRHRNN